MSNEIKEKEEYEKYARDHRKELDAQEVKLGDVVTVLVGQFAGETGIVIGIIACDKSDYTDPYYEIALNCEVPEKYKCRKTLITPNNVAGGFAAHDFEVIGNRAPKQPSMEIKQGDTVRVSKDAPKIFFNRSVCSYLEYVFEVREVEDGNADIYYGAGKIPLAAFIIPTKYLVKVDAEAKEAKFKKGDKVKYVGKEHPEYWGEVFTVDGEIFYNDYHKNMQIDSVRCEKYNICNVPLSDLEPYTEGATPTIKVGDRVRHMKVGQTWKVTAINGDLFTLKSDFGHENVCFGAELELVEPTEHRATEKKPNVGSIKIPVEVDLSDSYWDAYVANLAKEIALKVANKYNDPKQAAEYAVLVAKAVVEGLKRK